MNVFTSSIAIRHLLVADAVISGTTGIVMIALAGTVEPLLNIPAPLMRTAGVLLLPFAAMVWYFSRAPEPRRARVWTVIVLNFAWVAASVLALVAGMVEPTTLGTGFIVFQAAVVAILAEMQFFGLRRSSLAT